MVITRGGKAQRREKARNVTVKAPTAVTIAEIAVGVPRSAKRIDVIVGAATSETDGATDNIHSMQEVLGFMNYEQHAEAILSNRQFHNVIITVYHY